MRHVNKNERCEKNLDEKQLLGRIADMVICNREYGVELLKENSVAGLFPELAELESFVVVYKGDSYLDDLLDKIKAMPVGDTRAIFEAYHEFYLIEIKDA